MGNEEAEAFIDAIQGLPIESLEEPLAEPDLPGLSALQARADFPLALDESLSRFPVDVLLSRKPAARLVLKPMLLGGLLPALALARKAQGVGLQSVVTGTVDSAVGTWAGVHLAAAVETHGNGLCHGLATSRWLVQDIAEPPDIHAGKILVRDHAGLGIQPTL